MQTIGNVLILRNSIVKDMDLLQQRLQTIGKDCSFVYNLHTVSDKSLDDIYTILYVRDLQQLLKHYIYKPPYSVESVISIFYFAEVMPSIASFFIIVDYPTFAEIYSVCTALEHRKKGYVSEMLETIIQNYSKKILWLGVLLENPMFDSVVKLYASQGFKHPHLSYTNLTGIKITGDRPFLSLVLLPSIEKAVEEETKEKRKREAELVLLQAKNIQAQAKFIEGTGGCIFTYQIGDTILRYFQELIRIRTIEMGGIMRIYSYEAGIIPFTELAVVSNKIYEGTGEPTYGVTILRTPPTYFYFHTHPNIATMSDEFFITWPSNVDTALVFTDFLINQTLASIVVSVEGIYALSLSAQTIWFLQTHPLTPECIIRLFELISIKFRFSETFELQDDPRREPFIRKEARKRMLAKGEAQAGEQLLIEEEVKTFIVEQYFRTLHTYTLKMLLDDAPDVRIACLIQDTKELDFVLFHMVFRSWEELTRTQQFNGKTQFNGQIFLPAASCKLPNDKEPGETYYL